MAGAHAAGGDLTGMKFAIDNARKDLRYFTHLAEMLPVTSFIGEAVHQSFVQAANLGLGDKLDRLAVRGPGTAQQREDRAPLKPVRPDTRRQP